MRIHDGLASRGAQARFCLPDTLNEIIFLKLDATNLDNDVSIIACGPVTKLLHCYFGA